MHSEAELHLARHEQLLQCHTKLYADITHLQVTETKQIVLLFPL